MRRITFPLAVLFALGFFACGGDPESVADDGPICPDGIDDSQASPTLLTCDSGQAEATACCASTELYCVNLGCPAGASGSTGCNTYAKTLFTCGGERYGAGTLLDDCNAATFDELNMLDGTPCTNEPPCDITTGDLDRRVAICSGGTWHVFP